MDLRAGSRWRSAVCDTELIVVRAPAGDVVLECGGHPVIPIEAQRPADLQVEPDFAGGTPVGKRYADPELGIEVLATKAGVGTIAVNGVALSLKDAKPLPASD
jgi:hypothetical protein